MTTRTGIVEPARKHDRGAPNGQGACAPRAVDASQWLDHGCLPAEGSHLRREALRVARLIEYGGPLRRLEGRETLIECRQRTGGRSCAGFLWVSKRADDRISVFCSRCHEIEAVISGWEETAWADGPMAPLPTSDD